jgi:branched-chain amino acid transport system ATP-binding protein
VSDVSELLAVSALCARYGKVEALHDLDVSVGRGQIVTVIGANGAGKSTLLNALMGALPPRSSATGTVLLEGVDISRWDVERRVNLGMSLVPETRELFSTMSVLDNLRLGAFRRYRRRERGWDDQLDRVFSLFPRLSERQSQAAGTLSGGERQMLALGRALMAKPRILMLDEPSLGLAPLIVREIFTIIAELKRADVAVLLVEQNARAALQVADFGYVLETGECTLSGAAADLAHNPAVIESYLGLGAGARRDGPDQSQA